MIINIDCKYYLGGRPCKFHKLDKRLCDDCENYEKVGKRILIVKLDALGDVLRTTSILPSLNNKFPDSQITWVTKDNAKILLENNSLVNRILSVDGNYLSAILNEEFDIGICLDADILSASVLSLAKCKEKLGFIVDRSGRLITANKEAEKWYLSGLNDDLKKQNRDSYQKLIYEICKLDGEIFRPQINIDKEISEITEKFVKKNNLENFKCIVGINTGGGSRWECKSWIGDYYKELITKLQNYYKDVGLVIFGGEKEKELIDYLKENVKKPFVDAECYDSVAKFAGILNLVDIFFTPDSLGFHLSVALEKYTIVMVGPTSPWELDVYGKGEIVFNENLDCIACYDPVCKRNKECMTSITPDGVFKRITDKIDEISNS